ncbi:MAG: N-acetyltransferase [Nitrospirae bacterium]|nr:N-acetyltransferase [Nitrospirota bacterium]MBF0540981.1 N-acetyltransferase [Nitrospirota bacterium]
MKIKNASIADVTKISELISTFANMQLMLNRPLSELYENIRDYFVCIEDDEIVGVCGLHVLWEDLAEIKSLAVKKAKQKKGIGSALVRHCIEDAKRLKIDKVFALTYNPQFFIKNGFIITDKSSFPQKIWTDCVKCSKFPKCDEEAVIINLKPKE